MNKSTTCEKIFGALVHDIGKFMQRAANSENALSSTTIGLESSICPVYKGKYGYRHVLFTSEFCSRHLTNLPEGLSAHTIHSLAAYHHRPADADQEIVQESDRLSAGMERIQEDESPHAKSRFRQTRLRSVMADIGTQYGQGAVWEYDLASLGPHHIFPSERGEDPHAPTLTKEYAHLWDGFIQDWAGNRVQDVWGFINRCLGILEQYAWCIPSATWGVVPDISLYDHMKTSAAIAGCLSEATGQSEPFLFVVSDFGGIQSYIFDIRSGAGGIAKRLRSRSFFVDMANCSAAFRILRGTEMPLTNCLMMSGGKFILILPNTEKTNQELTKAQAALNSWTMNQTGGEVRLNMAALSCGKERLHNYPDILGELNNRLQREKLRPLKSYFCPHETEWDENRFLLSPLINPEREEDPCLVCQKKPALLNIDGDPICDSCSADSRMGAIVPKSRFAAFYHDDGSSHQNWNMPFGSVLLTDTSANVPGQPFIVLGLDGMTHDPPDLPIAPGYRTRWVPMDEHGAVHEFETIAEQSNGRKALACLKADVDNLGWIFRCGLLSEEADKRSISRLSTLSGAFTHFFSHYMEHLLRKEFSWTYTVYAGGDDLLCFGPWDEIFRLAGRLRSDFSRLCCNNPLLTMSAGIVLAGSKTPVNTVVERTERILEVSKKICGDSILPEDAEGGGEPRKDRITAFETSLPWKTYPEVLRKADRFLNLLLGNELSTSQMRRLLSFSELYRNYQKTGKTSYFQYAPMMVYDLRRNWQPEEPSPDYREMRQWIQSLTVPGNADMSMLRFIAQYALYGIRTGSGGNDG